MDHSCKKHHNRRRQTAAAHLQTWEDESRCSGPKAKRTKGAVGSRAGVTPQDGHGANSTEVFGDRPVHSCLQSQSRAVILDPETIGPGVVGLLPEKRQKSPRKSKNETKAAAKKSKKPSSSQLKQERLKLMERVARSNLSVEQLKLMRSSSDIGVRNSSLRSRLKRHLHRERASLPTEDGVERLYVAASHSDAESDVSHANGDEEPEENTAAGIPEAIEASESSASSSEGISSGEQCPDGKSTEQELQGTPSIDLRQPTPASVAQTTSSVSNAPRAGGSVVENHSSPQPILKTSRVRRKRTGKMTVAAARELMSVTNDRQKDEEALSQRISTVSEVIEALTSKTLSPGQQPEHSEGSSQLTGDTSASSSSEEVDNQSTSTVCTSPHAEPSSLDVAQAQSQNQTEGAVNDESRRSSKLRAKRGKLVVNVDRDASVEETRLQLPVCEKEYEIMEAVTEDDVIVITGATGTGKTTQVPQFLYEAGFGDPRSREYPGTVVVTQPRRVAVTSCASRVADELNVELGAEVGYQIRHTAKMSNKTKIRFVTDGIILREIEEDLLLRKCSAVIVDEAHERSINTDLLLTLLSKAVLLRRADPDVEPLKVIVMSATLSLQGIFVGASRTFRDYRLVEIPSRQHPVTVHFSRHTARDYLAEAHSKVCKIHRRLPAGGVLVFVTGRAEVETLCKKLKESLSDVSVLPLYAMLSEKQQHKVFVASKGRKIVVSTNVAETSITIPDITYVVDSGRAKERTYDTNGLLSSFEVKWISKSSAEQRSGRAGRTRPGHCYRLFSSAVFNHEFDDEQEPEIRRAPVDTLVLRLYAMGISDIMSMPLPTKPESASVSQAQALLGYLGAVSQGKITALGEELAMLPVSPRLARVLVDATSKGCGPLACRLVSIMDVGMLTQERIDFTDKLPKYHCKQSELIGQLRVLCHIEQMRSKGQRVKQFCTDSNLQLRNVLESLAIATQLEQMMGLSANRSQVLTENVAVTSAEVTVLLKALLYGFPDHIARCISRAEASEMGFKVGRSFSPLQTTCLEDEVAYVHSRIVDDNDAEYVCFFELVRFVRPASDVNSSPGRVQVLGASVVERGWIAECAAALCTFGPALCEPAPYYDTRRESVCCYVKATYGPGAYSLGTVVVEFTSAISDSKVPMAQYKVFARALLEGKVFPGLFTPTKGVDLSHQRFDGRGFANLVSILAAHKIFSKDSLSRECRGNRQFLIKEVAAVLSKDAASCMQFWPFL